MRVFAVLLLLLTSSIVVPANAAERCPADTFEASMAIWPIGAIPTRQTRIGRHPCGRRMKCTGGLQVGTKIRRSCRWL